MTAHNLLFGRTTRPVNRQIPAQRSGRFGANRSNQLDRASTGAQRVRNALQGRMFGGNRQAPFGDTRMQRFRNRQRQMFAERVGGRPGQVNPVTPRMPLFGKPNRFNSDRSGIIDRPSTSPIGPQFGKPTFNSGRYAPGPTTRPIVGLPTRGRMEFKKDAGRGFRDGPTTRPIRPSAFAPNVLNSFNGG